MTRALVTGGGGFLGSAIARMLVNKGWKVDVLGRSAYPELESLDINCYQIDLLGQIDCKPEYNPLI